MSILNDIEQVGANLLSDIKQWVMPTPQWILTPKAETELEKIGQLQPIKDVFNKATSATNEAYANIFPNIISGITTPLGIGILAAVIIFLYLLLRKR